MSEQSDCVYTPSQLLSSREIGLSLIFRPHGKQNNPIFTTEHLNAQVCCKPVTKHVLALACEGNFTIFLFKKADLYKYDNHTTC